MMVPRVALYCLAGGLALTPAAGGTGGFGWWWLSGIVLAAAFVPVAISGPRGIVRQLGVIVPVLLVVSVLCTWTEGLLFLDSPAIRDQAVRNLVGSSVVYATLGVALAVLASALGLTAAAGEPVEAPPLRRAALLVLACGVAYAVYYLVFGAVTYHFFTKGYYPDAERVVARLGAWFWLLQVGRGALMAVAVLPVVYTLRMGRAGAAVTLGALLWVAGGAAPLIPPNAFMDSYQRAVHIVEILTQNGPLGVTVALLMRPRRPRRE
jgi:hypothetical protein